MTPKSRPLSRPPVERPAFERQDRPSKFEQSSPGTIEEFDRERLGIAAKE
jgi:hypothetical protein